MRSLARSQDAYDRFSAAVGLPLTVLALLWLPVVVVPLVVPLPADVASTFNVIDYLVWAVYAAEYLVRLYLAPSRWRFFTHHLVDLAVVALPLLRPLRALRLLRLLNLARVGAVLANALTRARELFTHRGLNFVLLSVLGIIIVCSGLELAFEQHASGSTIHNFGDALWWATVTVTTVGYGDMYPVSAGGRGVAVVLMLVGIGLIGVLTATVASYFIEEQADQERADLNQRLDRIEAMLAQALARPDESDLFRRGTRPRRAQSSTPASEVPSSFRPVNCQVGRAGSAWPAPCWQHPGDMALRSFRPLGSPRVPPL
jgi:voltage-gated potassium channel